LYSGYLIQGDLGVVDVTVEDDFVVFVCDQNVSVYMGPMVNGYGVMGVSDSHEHTPMNSSTFSKHSATECRQCEQVTGISLAFAHALFRISDEMLCG
jgi:hypothetical protein